MKLADQIFEISKSVSFEAAHSMPGRSTADPYGRIHGHSFTLEACITGQVKDGEKWVEDIAALTASLKAIAEQLDHKMLNEIAGLEVPTLETIAFWVAQRLRTDLPGLSKVTISRPSLHESCTLAL